MLLFPPASCSTYFRILSTISLFVAYMCAHDVSIPVRLTCYALNQSASRGKSIIELFSFLIYRISVNSSVLSLLLSCQLALTLREGESFQKRESLEINEHAVCCSRELDTFCFCLYSCGGIESRFNQSIVLNLTNF